MNVLVTGGAGFIGNHTVRCLIEKGYDVTVVDDLSRGNAGLLPLEAHFYPIDILTPQFQEFMAARHFDAVIYLAAQIEVASSERDPLRDASLNIGGTLAVLEGARKSHVSRFVFASSAAVYGHPSEALLPLAEEAPLCPLSPYGLSKVTAENYIRMLAPSFSMEWVILRFANVYGEREVRKDPGGVIQIFANQIARHRPITLFGATDPTRDWIYVRDVAEALAKSLVTTRGDAVYNISTGKEVSLKTVLAMLERAAGYSVPHEQGPKRYGDIHRSVLSCAKARTLLAWIPKMTLEEGLFRTFRFAQDQARQEEVQS